MDLAAIAFKRSPSRFFEKLAAAQAMFAKACGKNSGIFLKARAEIAENKGEASLQSSFATAQAMLAKFCSVKLWRIFKDSSPMSCNKG